MYDTNEQGKNRPMKHQEEAPRTGIAPCHVPGTKPNACALAVHEMRAYGKGDLGGPWSGWRLAGRYLVTPDGLRMLPERIRGLAWRQDSEDRLERARAANEARHKDKQLVRVVVITLAEFRAMNTGAA